jgi:hypothetical protein
VAAGQIVVTSVDFGLCDLLMIHQLVLGTGRRLFPAGVQVPLRLADGVITSTGVVIASYELTTG